jgi:hypothetical protein
MTQEQAFALIAAGRLPRCDVLTHKTGDPAWKLDTLLEWLRVPEDQFIQTLPTKREQRGVGQSLGANGGF